MRLFDSFQTNYTVVLAFFKVRRTPFESWDILWSLWSPNNNYIGISLNQGEGLSVPLQCLRRHYY